LQTRHTRFAVFALAVFLVGCGPSRVIVQGEFPEPLIQPLPMTVGVWYEESFSGHEFFDDGSKRRESSWGVVTGEAQVAMWDSLLKGMFTKVVNLAEPPSSEHVPAGVDAVIIPHIEELQYALPKHTHIKVYEIWMRYRIELVTPEGEPITKWKMTSYGKTPTAFLQSDEAAINLAAVMALRDAAANFATNLEKVPGFEDWAQQRAPTNDGGRE